MRSDTRPSTRPGRPAGNAARPRRPVRATAARARGIAPRPAPAATPKWEVERSRSVTNGWVWRGFLVMSIIAVGVALVLNGNHMGTLALLWLVIAAGWFGCSMWLWRRHTRYMRS